MPAPATPRLSLPARLARPAMRGLQYVLGHGRLAQRRARTDALGRLLDLGVRGVSTTRTALGGVPVEVHAAAGAGADAPAVLYLHGGGYVLGGPRTHAGLAKALARAIEGTVFVPDYRLAPEHPFPAALDDADAVWRALVAGPAGPGRLVVAGDSAGGGLGLALALRLKAERRPLPAGLVLLSPWTDLTLARLSAVAATTPEWVLSAAFLGEAAGWYAQGHDRTDPFVSPLFGSFDGLPPVLLQTGGDEILGPDTTLLAAAMRAAGVRVEGHPWPGLWHVFQLQVALVPEARAALAEIGAFVRALPAAAPAFPALAPSAPVPLASA